MTHWVKEIIQQLMKDTLPYEKRAVLLAVEKYIIEQEKRIYQLEQEVDGKMWNPSKW